MVSLPCNARDGSVQTAAQTLLGGGDEVNDGIVGSVDDRHLLMPAPVIAGHQMPVPSIEMIIQIGSHRESSSAPWQSQRGWKPLERARRTCYKEAFQALPGPASCCTGSPAGNLMDCHRRVRGSGQRDQHGIWFRGTIIILKSVYVKARMV